jgi:hypothetical protein
MRLVRINTTAYSEEDFFLVTTLTDEQISLELDSFLFNQRFGNDDYDNDDIFRLLTLAYPNEKVIMYNDIETLQL